MYQVVALYVEVKLKFNNMKRLNIVVEEHGPNRCMGFIENLKGFVVQGESLPDCLRELATSLEANNKHNKS